MIEPLIALVVDESKWLAFSMGVAMLAVLGVLARRRRAALANRRRVMMAMNLFFGVTIGTMALGHLLAVTVKLVTGTLAGSLAAFYAIGVALAVPSWWLVWHARRMPATDVARTTLGLNGWLVVTLLALGLHNLPLAAPGLLNIGYRLHGRRIVGRAIVGLAVVVNLGLFVGAVIFLASGQSFEQFR